MFQNFPIGFCPVEKTVLQKNFLLVKDIMKNFFLLFPFFLLLSLIVFFFNTCSGAASRKAEILRSLNSNLETAPAPKPPKSVEEAEEIINNDDNATEEEAEPPPKDPKAFTYFPYDLSLDTIALMTCENPALFTFKAGAYFERSGLRLSEYFLRKKLDASDLKTLIESSTTSRAMPLFFLRHKINIFSGGYSIAFNIRLWRHLDELITQGPSRLREIEGEPISAEIHLDPSKQASYIMLLNKSMQLGIFYWGHSNKIIHKTNGDKGVDFYGRMYKVAVQDRGNNRYHLNSISEKKLPSAPAQKEWNCPEDLRFEIRRHPERAWSAQKRYEQNLQTAGYKDKYPTLESALNAEDSNHRVQPDEALCPTSNAKGAALTVAKKVLGDAWHINIDRKCISLKTNSSVCYNTPFLRLGRSSSCANTRNGFDYCPQYLSICVRKNN